MRKRFLSLACVLVLALGVSACSTKDTVVAGLLALQSAAISANGPDSVKIVTYTTQAEQAIFADANGWQAAVQTGWAAFVADLPAADKAAYATPIAVVSGAIGSL